MPNFNQIEDDLKAAIAKAARGGEIKPDAQELAEREEAAQAYAGEDEAHFVAYVEDCVKTTSEARRDIRQMQMDCWDVFNEKMPATYAAKEPWQSKTIVPKPFASVMYGASAVKRAFSPDYLSVHDPKSEVSAFFWQRVMERQFDDQHADFPLNFIGATIMGLAVGESMEMIPRWIPGKGLAVDLIEPWKIYRDPDAPPRDPQGGLYWIHRELLDYFVLVEAQKAGKYENVERVKDFGTGNNSGNDPFMTPEAIAARKDQIRQRSAFRAYILTSEFWGSVLSPKGELLLPKATYTVAAGRVIQKPVAVEHFKTLRWPGVFFSPLPDLLRSGGRGLVQGIIPVWHSMNTLMCLHEDALKWIVNPTIEINVDALVDSDDVEDWPGKKYLVRDTMNGQQAIRTTVRRDNTPNVLANLQYLDQNFQRGAFVTDAVQGLPGYRQEVTWRESRQNLEQSLGIFTLMGSNIEAGAIQFVKAAFETVLAYAKQEDLSALFTDEEILKYGLVDQMTRSLIVPELTGSFHISGIQSLMRDAETLINIREVTQMCNDQRLAPFIRPSKLLKAYETRVNLKDENCFVDEKTGEMIEQLQIQSLIQQWAMTLGGMNGLPQPGNGGEPGNGGAGMEQNARPARPGETGEAGAYGGHEGNPEVAGSEEPV